MKGLYQKYAVSKADGSAVDPDAIYFVLRLDKGEYVDACRMALDAFAMAIWLENPTLADDCIALLERLEARKEE